MASGRYLLRPIAEVYSTMLNYLLPERCRLCTGASERGFCAGCRAEFAAVADPCPVCALAQPVRHCPREDRDWVVKSTVAPLRYEYPLTAQIHALKFSSGRNLGRPLGLLLADRLRGRPETQSVDGIVAVPLHRRRLLERGYNQALEIARPVAAELKRPLLIAGIARTISTRPQTELDMRERRESVTNAFSVSRSVEGRNIAIVDDVITTGATVNSLATALRLAGAADVQAWAVARAL